MNLSFSLTVNVMQHNNEMVSFLVFWSHIRIFFTKLCDSQNIGQTFRRISIANITSENIQPIVQRKTHRAFVAT